MIPLLRELAAAALNASLPDDAEHARALRLLGWERVAGQVAARARTRRGAASLRARRPYVDPEPIARRRRLQDEVRAALADDDSPPLADPSDALDLLERPRPWRLSGEELLHLAVTAADLDAFRHWCLRRAEAAPDWAEAAGALAALDAVHGRILAMLDRDGRVKDDATPRLRTLRRTARERERQARDAVTRAMDHARAKGWANGPEVTLRGERFCLPLQAGARRRVDGIVHDRSATGGTVYVEPADVVHLQNDLVEARLEAAAEVERILLELNGVVEARAEDLASSAALLLLADEALAAVVWSREMKGVRPELERGIAPDLHGVRHPLLLAQAASADDVVPLDLAWPDRCRALLISGPNAGGKSVALKGVGVAVLLAQCGWDVPAGPGTRLPLIRRLGVDLGDDQSISRSLSSFSAHLDHLGRFLATADHDTLILCDEIGSGTDPEEGSVLAFTVLEALVERGALVLASTHYGLLKAAVHDHPAMVNAAMDFDAQDLRPLFTLRLGVPGASHAFAIASRLGLPADLLAKARERVGEERFRVERLLTELGERTRRLAETEARLETSEREALERGTALDKRLQGLERERKELLASTRREGEAFLEEARRTLEGVVREIRSGGAEREAIKAGRARLADVAAGLPRAPAPEPPPDVAEGDQVRIPHLGWTGRVMEARGDRLVVDAQGTRLTLGRDAVEALAGGQKASNPDPTTNQTTSWRWRAAAGPLEQELDLRGFRADEGWDALDRLLDRAIPAGTREVRVIHGHGTGRLKAYLRRRLADDARVADACDAAPDQGGDGCTVVRLADV